MKAFQKVFEDGASPFARWTLSPALILIMVFFASLLEDPEVSSSSPSRRVILLLEVLFLAALLSLWGVPYVVRIVTGFVAAMTAYLLIKEVYCCLLYTSPSPRDRG